MEIHGKDNVLKFFWKVFGLFKKKNCVENENFKFEGKKIIKTCDMNCVN